MVYNERFIKFLSALVCLLPILFLFCAHKTILWHGSYTDLVTPEVPKEDFKVGEYLVVSYAPAEKLKYPLVLYTFALIKDSTQIGLICYEKIPRCGYLLVYEFFDKYNIPIDDIERFYKNEKNNLMTLELYKYPLSYNELKYIIISELLGLKGLHYTDYTNEGDTVSILLKPNGKWDAIISRDVKINFSVPAILGINNVKVLIKDDRTWEFINAKTITDDIIHGTITVNPKPILKRIYSFDQIEIKPKLVSAPTPFYPESMERKGIGGKTIITMLIETDGSVLSCKIFKSSGHSELDFSALCAGLKHKFTPAIQDGTPVRGFINRSFEFELR